jgi:hypothetical protein
MGLKITGECKVYNLKQNDKSVAAGLGLSTKDNEGNWKTEFIQGYFVKEAFEPATRLDKKDKIEIVSGSLNIKTVENDGRKNTYYSVTVFEFNNLTHPEEDGDFHPAGEEDSEELPF